MIAAPRSLHNCRTDLFENEGIYGSARSPEGDLIKVPGVAKDHNQLNALGVELGVCQTSNQNACCLGQGGGQI